MALASKPSPPALSPVDARQRQVQSARSNLEVFAEHVLRAPDTGEPIALAAVHLAILRHIQWSWANGYHVGIIAPWAHGKTVVGVLSPILWEMGRNPALRVKLVCNSDPTATARVTTIGQYIRGEPAFHEVFPDCRPSSRDTDGAVGSWTTHRLRLDREVPSPDASLEAWGVNASGVGGRCDLLVCDDIVDERNALQHPAMREQIKETFRGAWLSRLEPQHGKVLYVGTRWHEADLTADLQENPGFSWLEIAVSDDMSRLDAVLRGGGRAEAVEFTLPLWSEKWDSIALRKARITLGPREFDRGMRQRPYSDAERTFPHFRSAVRPGVKASDVAPESWPAFVGVDVSGQARSGTVIFVGRVDPRTRTRVPVEVIYGRWSAPQKAQRLQAVWERYRPRVILVENNALQDELIQWCRADPQKWKFSVNLQGYFTGKQKFDRRQGLPSLDIEFSLGDRPGGWIVPGGEFMGHRDSACGPCGWCRWVKEMEQHPFGESSDAVMACWIFAEAVRKYAGFTAEVGDDLSVHGHLGLTGGGIVRGGQDRDIVAPQIDWHPEDVGQGARIQEW